MKNEEGSPTKGPWIVAHRGWPAAYPENTMTGFEKALELPVDAIEFDLHPTRDGKIVVTHDDTLERCSDGRGAVRDHTLAELKALDFGSWKGSQFAGTRIPEFRDVLDLVERRRPDIFLLVELKEDNETCALQALEELKRRGRLRRCAIISFKPAMLRLAHAFDPSLETHGFESSARGMAPEEKAGYFRMLRRIAAHLSELTPEFVEKYQSMGLFVDTWGVENAEAWTRALACGVNSVTTDNADVVTKLREQTFGGGAK